MRKLHVIGSINQDIVVKAARAPRPGETVLGSELLFFAGGKGANQAVAAHRLGGDVIFRGMVGDDSFGEGLRRNLDREGMPYRIDKTPAAATGTAIIFVANSGENSITVIPGANGELRAEDILPLNASEGDILLLQNEISFETNRQLLTHAKAIGMITMFNPAPAMAADAEFRANLDWLIINEHEYSVFFEEDFPKNVDRNILRSIVHEKAISSAFGVVLTLGSQGVIAARGDDAIMDIAGHEVNTVDSTGAGDCFVGALAAGLSRGESVKHALVVANLAASISVTRMGAYPSFPTWNELIAV